MTEYACERLNRMRAALNDCTFPPYTAAKRFARQVSALPEEQVSAAQWLTVVVLSHRFRRQMPRDLVPTATQLAHAKNELEKARVLKEGLLASKREAREAKRAEKRGVPPGTPLLDLAAAS